MLDITNEEQYENEIFMTMIDNGDDENPICGLGEDRTGLYLVDLVDTCEVLREKLYIKETISSHDLILKGIEMNVFVKTDDDEILYNIEDETFTSWETFLEHVVKDFQKI